MIHIFLSSVHAGVLSGQTQDHWKHGYGHETSEPPAAAWQSQAVRGGASCGWRLEELRPQSHSLAQLHGRHFLRCSVQLVSNRLDVKFSRNPQLPSFTRPHQFQAGFYFLCEFPGYKISFFHIQIRKKTITASHVSSLLKLYKSFV